MIEVIDLLKERAHSLKEQGLDHSVHYQELIKQIEILEDTVDSAGTYVYPGSDCQDAL